MGTFKAILSCVLLVAGAGCVGPSFATREVHREASWFVRLDTFKDPGRAAEVHHDHPAVLSAEELTVILSRLMVQERVGLFDEKPFPQPVFSSTEISRLAPTLQAAFRLARPSEWVIFYSERQTGVAPEITSGGFFLKGGHLHVLIANHRSWARPVPDEVEEVRANPVRPQGGKGIALSFDPPRYVLKTQVNWMGGSSGAPASELILDYKAFLREVRAEAPIAPRDVIGQRAGEEEEALGSLKNQVMRLQQEVERLRQKANEQATELEQLKARLNELGALSPTPPTKKR